MHFREGDPECMVRMLSALLLHTETGEEGQTELPDFKVSECMLN